jgi:hypothetical protein
MDTDPEKRCTHGIENYIMTESNIEMYIYDGIHCYNTYKCPICGNSVLWSTSEYESTVECVKMSKK